MPNKQPANHSSLNDDVDILNDSISMNMEDDSFDGNDQTFVLPSSRPGPTGPSSSSRSNLKSSSNPNPHSSQSVRSKSEENPVEPEDLIKDNYHADPLSSSSSQKKASKKENNQINETKLKNPWLRRETRRNQELENERDWLREINRLLEKSANEIDQIEGKIENVQTAAQTSHDLLNVYSKILTQTEHTKDLLSNSTWEGLSVDTKRREEARQQEKIRLAKQREQEREEQRLKEELEQQKLQAEAAAADRTRKQNPLQKSTRSIIPTSSRGRARGRTTRGKTR